MASYGPTPCHPGHPCAPPSLPPCLPASSPRSIYPFDNQGEDAGLSEAQKVRKMLERMENEAYALNPQVGLTGSGWGEGRGAAGGGGR